MQHDLGNLVPSTTLVTFRPIITDGISVDTPIPIKVRRHDRSAYFRVSLQSVFCVFVPEVECAVAAGGCECAEHGVEGDGVDGVDVYEIPVGGGGLAVAFEGEVVAKERGC